MLLAVEPVVVKATIALTFSSLAAFAAARQMNSTVPCAGRLKRCSGGAAVSRSTCSETRISVRTASRGKAPTEVSAESIMASVPSRIALATSEVSAREGTGLEIMDSDVEEVVRDVEDLRLCPSGPMAHVSLGQLEYQGLEPLLTRLLWFHLDPEKVGQVGDLYDW